MTVLFSGMVDVERHSCEGDRLTQRKELMEAHGS